MVAPPEDPSSESEYELEDTVPARSAPPAQAPLTQMLGDAWRRAETERTRMRTLFQGFAAAIDQQLAKYQEAFPTVASHLTEDLKEVLKRHFADHLSANPRSQRPGRVSYAEAAKSCPLGSTPRTRTRIDQARKDNRKAPCEQRLRTRRQKKKRSYSITST
jgi:hypothetical protein